MTADDDYTAALAAVDQLGAQMRSIWGPAIAGYERHLIELGASPELACWAALDYQERIMSMASFPPKADA